MKIDTHHRIIGAALLLVANASPVLAGTINNAEVLRTAPDTLTIKWADADSVDVFATTDAKATVTGAKLISGKDSDGQHQVVGKSEMRQYFLLRDTKSGQVVRLAERLIPLAQSSNFRDVGGYTGADGKTVRWGQIYRSGGTALLTDADVESVKSLGITDLVDLRSSEERVIAPTRLDGIPYATVGYSLKQIMSSNQQAATIDIGQAYRNFPALLAPHMRILFAKMLESKGPVAYNCAAGQDRTGFATAMVLTTLGVARETIYQDYLVSTQYRRPEFEMPKIEPALAASNPVAAFFASYQKDPEASRPKPLVDNKGGPLLNYAFDEIEKRWGSVEGYLKAEIGLTQKDIERLRARYLVK